MHFWRGQASCLADLRAEAVEWPGILSNNKHKQRSECNLSQVDMLRPGLLGPSREAYAARYCSRRLVPVARSAEQRRWDNGGLSHAHELHALLSQVSFAQDPGLGAGHQTWLALNPKP